ncbi:MAG: T9SS type A sorting domain-containing protein, partial [Dysgonamonadaceae bacterium]|nr:T9SS type A sorting domain-containing protein [Dysgonamonadaceae bacterium]
DISALYLFDDYPAEVFEVKNSYIGHTLNISGKTGVDPALNNIDYYTEEEYDAEAAGLDDPTYYAVQYYAIPLLEDAATRTFGNPEYLIGDKDLSGKTRTITDGKCAIGASEVTSAELDEGVDFETGITTPPAAAPVKVTISKGVILCLTNEPADIELYNLTGSKIARGKNYLSTRGIPSGVYIAKVRAGSNEYKQKLILHAE